MNFLHVILRQWRQRPARTSLSILSVAIAVAAVLGTALAQSSVRLGVKQLSREVDKRPSLEIVSMAGGRLEQNEVPSLAEVPGVVDQVPVVSRATLARVHGKRFRTVLVGLPLAQPEAWRGLVLTTGRACEAENEAVLSADLAKTLKAEEGDRLVVLTKRGPRSATIVGLAEATSLGEFAPAASLVMSLDAVQGFFGLDGQVDRMRVLIDSTDQREAILAGVAAKLPKELTVQVPLAPMEMIDTTLRSTELALRFAGAMSMAMAAFIILNTLRLNFSERRRDMAVIRVLGATPKQMLSLHLFEGLALGLCGSLVGAPLGIWLGRGLEAAMAGLLEVQIPTPEVSYLVVGMALALGPVVACQAALVPALQSRGVSAVEALGDSELRRSERFPRWATYFGIVAWGVSVGLVTLVSQEKLPTTAAIPAGLLMLVAFITIIPAVMQPVVRTATWVLSPWFQMEGRLGSDQLLARSTRTALTVGVLVVALSASLGLGTAIINNVDDVRSWYRRSLSGDVFLMDAAAADRAAATQDRRDIAAELAQQPNIAQFVEVRLLPARANGMNGMCIVRNFLPEVELPWSLSPDEEAHVRQALRGGETAISNVMARKLGVSVGDDLRLELQGRVFSFRVAALVNDYMLGGRVAYLDQATAAKMVELGPAELFIVKGKADASTEALAGDLEKLFADEGVIVQSFSEFRRQLDGMINGIVGALWGLLGVCFLIGGVAVSNTLTMNVLEQTRELGLLRIIGMTPKQVRKLVFCEALLLGVLGALLGTAGGITTAIVIHFCNEPALGHAVPFTLHAWLLAANIGGCVLIALASAWSPGRRAARLNLLSAIAYE